MPAPPGTVEDPRGPRGWQPLHFDPDPAGSGQILGKTRAHFCALGPGGYIMSHPGPYLWGYGSRPTPGLPPEDLQGPPG